MSEEPSCCGGAGDGDRATAAARSGADGEAVPASERDPATVRRAVRERYADEATGADGCCEGYAGADAERLGYDPEAIAAGDADLSLGCGNPQAIADLEPGETVLDLGSGAGFDCFLAAEAVGPEGRVVGVDMTPEMVDRARATADEHGHGHVEFRLGEIEALPVADGLADVVISNCVINLSPAKDRVFREAYRALRPGGRLAVSDVVQTAPLPEAVRTDLDSLAGCVAGAATVERLESLLADAGFEGVSVEPVAESAEFIREWDEQRDLAEYLMSARIRGRKPAAGG